MTDDQLDAIEAQLGVTLPDAYRRVSRAAPFRPLGRDAVYWFYDDPDAVVGMTRSPHADAGYAGPGLPPRYVAIGDSAAGDAYLLDTLADGSPVACLSHETHAVEPEWPTFEAFVADWLAAPAEWERHLAAERAARAAWWRWYWRVLGVTVLVTVVVPLLGLALIVLARGR